jgi:hypothetical protein
MAHLLCINCFQKFDDEKSYTVREVTVPAFLTKSRHEEALSFRRPICPQCGAEKEFLGVEALRTKNRTGMQVRGATTTNGRDARSCVSATRP